ncbi:LysM domain-containing protein, partial [Acinetobacter baumannii]
RADEVVYAVLPGDTLYHLASRYFSSLRAIGPVRRLNHVVDVRRLPAGGFLRLPRGLLRDEPTPARVDSFSGEVTLRQNQAAPV